MKKLETSSGEQNIAERMEALRSEALDVFQGLMAGAITPVEAKKRNRDLGRRLATERRRLKELT